MNTNSLKKFATQARSLLMLGVHNRLRAIGFDEDGTVRETPHAVDGGVMLGSALVADPHFLPRWEALRHRIEAHGVKNVVEEAAYTWFNRLMALRILTRNGLAPAVLDYVNPDIRLPRIVTDARAGKTPVLSADDRAALDRVILDGSLSFEQFAILIRAVCENNAIIRNCFGGITDYTALLLPADILAEGNFIDLLNDADSFITADEWRKPELIGWLYQFYISEKKDEVFAKKGGYDSDEIPAATQIFTPNWIVKYMVENTLGRIYLDNNPDSPLAENWKYLVEPAEPTPADAVLRYSSLEELTCADLSCGSGHILNEMFDLLMQLYTDDFYSPREAIEAIFTKNMVGIDLDIRARQLAQFALLLKACQTDSAFANGHCMPRIYSFPEISAEQWRNYHGDIVKAYSIVAPSKQVFDEIEKACQLMEDADALGSIMKFDLSDASRDFIKKVIETYEASPRVINSLGGSITTSLGHTAETYIIPDESEYAQYSETLRPLIDAFRIMLALTDKYAAICMNPPYMSPGKNTNLNKYAKVQYPNSKTDLFAIFMELAMARLKNNGKYGMINLPSWLFLSSFEDLRKDIIDNAHIDSLIHMGRGIFGVDWGSTSFVITKSNLFINSAFFRLHERNFQHIYFNHIGDLFTIVLNNHGFKYNFENYRENGTVAEDFEFIHCQDGRQLYFQLEQHKLKEIPGAPIAYWVSDKIRETFTNNLPLSAVCKPTQGLATADNGRFVRSWFEVAVTSIGFGCESAAASVASGRKFFPYNKGGASRKWYGNQDLVVNWENDGYEIKHFVDEKGKLRSRPQNLQWFFKPSISWSKISAGEISFRYFPKGFIFDVAGTSLFPKDVNMYPYYIGVLNSNCLSHILGMISPTLNYEVGQIASLPIPDADSKEIRNVVADCISISKEDWDAHETSWDFATNPLLAVDTETYRGNIDWMIEKHRRKTGDTICIDPAAPELNSLRWRYEQYCQKWESLFDRLHRNEEELNRKFIEIYGLQDELKPNVPLKDVTILQQGEIVVNDKEEGIRNISYDESITYSLPLITFNADVVIKQFISYAIGCMMGRYRLDRPGLAIAHPNPTEEEVAEYVVPQTGEKWWIDDDGIVPMMGADSPFHDNAANRFSEFMRVALGNDSHTDNMNFVRESLGKDVVDYLCNDFYADHKRMYQNRPIYWMFSSNQKGKRAAFQCLVYMHRMDRFTPEHIRTNYLLPYIDHLAAREAELMAKPSLTPKEGKVLKQLRSDLDECRDYQLRLHAFADRQIAIDLDDGVVKNYATFASVLAKLK